ncbi:MAG: sigma-70 family RNA polymerase sigma factor, partial [Oscillospiraceae bacterium]|nr:sigma-70 family RNA polymerase sigma factor [Oscillospiraceae bacterium]
AEKRNSQYDFALDELEEYLSDSSNVEDLYSAKELAEAINGFMATLNYSDRFIFTRRYWYSDPVQDIAEMAHSTANSVTVRLFRIRKKLRLYLEKEGLFV